MADEAVKTEPKTTAQEQALALKIAEAEKRVAEANEARKELGSSPVTW